jgi:hypothetical protein
VASKIYKNAITKLPLHSFIRVSIHLQRNEARLLRYQKGENPMSISTMVLDLLQNSGSALHGAPQAAFDAIVGGAKNIMQFHNIDAPHNTAGWLIDRLPKGDWTGDIVNLKRTLGEVIGWTGTGTEAVIGSIFGFKGLKALAGKLTDAGTDRAVTRMGQIVANGGRLPIGPTLGERFIALISKIPGLKQLAAKMASTNPVGPAGLDVTSKAGKNALRLAQKQPGAVANLPLNGTPPYGRMAY